MISEKLKADIDNMSYEDMFRKRRFAPIGHPMFVGEVGEYFMERMAMIEPSPEERTAISKRIGWEP